MIQYLHLVRRLAHDVTALELQPAVEDIFPADTTSVEEYLSQLQEMSIITAIQVAISITH